MPPTRFPAKTISPRRSAAGVFTTRRNAASSARSGSVWNIGRSCVGNGDRSEGKAEAGMGMQQNFFLAVTLAAAVSTTALGQTPAPAVGSAGNGRQNAAAVPDFSGL